MNHDTKIQLERRITWSFFINMSYTLNSLHHTPDKRVFHFIKKWQKYKILG